MTLFRGLCAFPITPADADGRVDANALGRLLARLVEARVGSIGLLGSTGTYAYLNRGERRRAIETAVEVVNGAVPLMVGIGALRTDDAIGFGTDAREAGADAVLLAPMSYTPLTDDEAFEHYRAVAETVRLPLCIYDNPGTTHFRFGPGLIARLGRVPYIVALKSPAGETAATAADLARLRAELPDGFSLGSSVDGRATEALIAGGDSWYSVAAGLFPSLCQPIVAAVDAGDAALARELNAKLKPLWELFAVHSSLRVTYAAAKHLGICEAAPPRPVLPLDDDGQRRVRDVLLEAGLL